MRKCVRKWVKDEKRIVRLLYKKGFLKNISGGVERFYWEAYRHTKKTYKTKNSYDGRVYRFHIYYPEVFFGSSDYWGEWDDTSVVSHALECLYWEHAEPFDADNGEFPKSSFKIKDRVKFIKYLKGLKTVVSDNKINKVLKVVNNE